MEFLRRGNKTILTDLLFGDKVKSRMGSWKGDEICDERIKIVHTFLHMCTVNQNWISHVDWGSKIQLGIVY